MSGEAFALGFFALVTVLACVIVWSVFTVARARAQQQGGCDEACERRTTALTAEVVWLRNTVEELQARR